MEKQNINEKKIVLINMLKSKKKIKIMLKCIIQIKANAIKYSKIVGLTQKCYIKKQRKKYFWLQNNRSNYSSNLKIN